VDDIDDDDDEDDDDDDSRYIATVLRHISWITGGRGLRVHVIHLHQLQLSYNYPDDQRNVS